MIEKVAEVTGEKPRSVAGNNRTSVIIEVCCKQQARKLQDIESVEEFQCTVMLHPRFNYRRGIIYIHEFDVDNTEEFKDYLQQRYSIIDVQPADFIKPRIPPSKIFYCDIWGRKSAVQPVYSWVTARH